MAKPKEKIYSKAELREIMRDTARETARETVRETLQGLGVDMDDPVAVQHDFAFIREWRTLWASARRRAVIATVGVLITAAVGAILVSLRSLFTK
jgi:hypothetical protein